MIFPVDWEIFALFCLTEFAFSVSPGPAVFLVAAHAARGGMRPAAACAFGVLSGNLAYFALSATAVGALLAALREWFFVVKWCGAAYLFYLAARAFAVRGGAQNPPAREGVAFRESFLMQLANPKTILFFVAFLPLFVDAQKPVVAQMLVFAGASFLIELAVLCGYALATRRITARFGDSVARASWILLCCAAAALLFV